MVRNLNLKKGLLLGTVAAFLLNTWVLPTGAQDLILPVPGTRVELSPAFSPAILKGIKVHPDNPFRLDFVLDRGDEMSASAKGVSALAKEDYLKQNSTKLIKYFLASLTIPEKDLWVNLSPYEKDRIVPEAFGQTEMGRDLLAQDYMLKQITASLIYPEGEIGKQFWKRVYEEAAKKFGTTSAGGGSPPKADQPLADAFGGNISINTFNKVWIVPEKAVVYENVTAGTAYVVESRLKVMLEEDYLALQKNELSPTLSLTKRGGQSDPPSLFSKRGLGGVADDIVREIIIPQLTKEINQGKNFAQLRQVYNSLILATWYKKKIKDSILSQVYFDKNKIEGIKHPPKASATADPSIGGDQPSAEKIYERYLQAFKKGAYNYIKEEQDPVTQQVVPRKYFSGGMAFDYAMDVSMQYTNQPPAVLTDAAMQVTVDIAKASSRVPDAPLKKTFWGRVKAFPLEMAVVLSVLGATSYKTRSYSSSLSKEFLSLMKIGFHGYESLLFTTNDINSLFWRMRIYTTLRKYNRYALATDGSIASLPDNIHWTISNFNSMFNGKEAQAAQSLVFLLGARTEVPNSIPEWRGLLKEVERTNFLFADRNIDDHFGLFHLRLCVDAVLGFNLDISKFNGLAAVESKLIESQAGGKEEPNWRLASEYYKTALATHSKTGQLLTVYTYLESRHLEFEDALHFASREDQVQLKTLAWEALQLAHFIERLEARMKAEGRKVVVVANYSYGETAVLPMLGWLRRRGNKVIVTRIASTDAHRNPLIVNDRGSDLFNNEQIEMFLKEKPDVVVVDGSKTLNSNHKTTLPDRGPVYSDAYQGYRNWFIGLNRGMGANRETILEFQKSPEFLDRLEKDGNFRALRIKIEGLNSGDQTGEFYKMRFWTPAFRSGPNALGFSEELVPRSDHPPVFDFHTELPGPNLIMVESAIENTDHPKSDGPTIPPDIQQWIGGANQPAYFDNDDRMRHLSFSSRPALAILAEHYFKELRRRSKRGTNMAMLGHIKRHVVHDLRNRDDIEVPSELLLRYSAYKYGNQEQAAYFAGQLKAAILKEFGQLIKAKPGQWAIATTGYRLSKPSIVPLVRMLSAQLGVDYVSVRAVQKTRIVTPPSIYSGITTAVQRVSVHDMYDFYLESDRSFIGTNVILVDDFLATGMTLKKYNKVLGSKYQMNVVGNFNIMSIASMGESMDPSWEETINSSLIRFGSLERLAESLNRRDTIMNRYAVAALFKMEHVNFIELVGLLNNFSLAKLYIATAQNYRDAGDPERIKILEDRMKASFTSNLNELLSRLDAQAPGPVLLESPWGAEESLSSNILKENMKGNSIQLEEYSPSDEWDARYGIRGHGKRSKVYRGDQVLKVFIDDPRQIRFMRRLLKIKGGQDLITALRVWRIGMESEEEHMDSLKNNADFILVSPMDREEIRRLAKETEKIRADLGIHLVGSDDQYESKLALGGILDDVASFIEQRGGMDAAMKGGVDLNPANINLQTQNSGGEIKFHLDPAMLQQLQNASGFTPVIINIQPMDNLRLFLGLSDEKPAVLAQMS